ncbi:MAG: MerC domain-containing protein [Allomuricauda sp.]|nr:MAG: MerC domain-containing protein [Allomuricauda sp.]
MNVLQLTTKSDIIGASASALCLIHCVATPLLFVAQAGLVGDGESHPEWWGTLDFIFLFISLLAIWWSGKNTSKTWMRIALWASWSVLFFVVLNEKLSIIALAEQIIYIPAIALIFFHLYNRKYCQCGRGDCCTEELPDS